MIAARALFTVEISGTVGGFIPPTESSVRDTLVRALSGQFVVTSVVVESPIINNPFKWNFRATARLSAYTSYDNARVESDIARTVETALQYPATVSILDVGGQATGVTQPALDDPIVQVGSGVSGLVAGAKTAAEDLFGGVKSTVTLVVVGLVVVLAVVAFSPAGRTAAGRIGRG